MIALLLAGCGGNVNDNMDTSMEDSNTTEEIGCNIGEVYSLDGLSFDICSTNELTLGDSDGALRPIMSGDQSQTFGYVVEGDFENDLISVDRDELITALENNLFGGVEAVDENGYGANYVEFVGYDVIELDFLGDLAGNKRFFALVDGDLLKFDYNFNAIAVLSGVISR